MSNQIEYTKNSLLEIVLETIGLTQFENKDRFILYIGQYLCGINSDLARAPFSEEFLCNVAFNSDKCMSLILWLQLDKLQNP